MTDQVTPPTDPPKQPNPAISAWKEQQAKEAEGQPENLWAKSLDVLKRDIEQLRQRQPPDLSTPAVPEPEGPPAILKDWKLFTLEDACQDRPPIEYAVAGVFEMPSLNIVYGAPGCLKSFLLADMAVCVAAGLPWLPPLSHSPAEAKKTTQVPVAWIDYDNGPRRTHDRFKALVRATGVNPKETPLYYFSMPTPHLSAADYTQVVDVGVLLMRLGVRLLVVDNLATVSGGKDENSTEILAVMSNLRMLAERLQAAVVVIHHKRKSTNYDTRKGETMRGSSSIEGAIDLGLQVQREQGSKLVTIIATKERGRQVEPFAAEFTHESQGDELTAARFFGSKSFDPRAEIVLLQAIVSLLDEKGQMNQSTLVSELQAKFVGQLNPKKAREAIGSAAAQGLITATRKGKNNALVYTLRDSQDEGEPDD